MGSIQKKEELKLVTTENFAGLDVGFYQDDKGDVYMTRNQIGEALGYKNPNDSIRMIHKRNEGRMNNFSVSIKLFGTDDKAYNTVMYNEKGIYEIMRKSNQPKADDFYDFVYDIIENLRKGELVIMPSYQINDPIQRAERWIEEEEHRRLLEGEVLQLNDKIDEYEPKVRYVDEILSSTDTMSITQIAKDYGLSGRRLNQILHERGIQYKVNNQWVLYAKYAGAGYTKSCTHRYEKGAGRIGTNIQTVWTQKGRLLIHNTLELIGIIAEVDEDE